MTAKDCPPNKLGITDPELFRETEAGIAGVMQAAALSGQITLPEKHGSDRLRALHGALFSEIYDHAGTFRDYNFRKPEFAGSESGTAFCDHHKLDARLTALFTGLRQQGEFKGLGVQAFGDAATTFFDRLNQVHPFVEGNGRTQMAYLTMLASNAGHDLPFTGITRGRMYGAAHAAAHGDPSSLRELIAEQMDPERHESLAKAHAFLIKVAPLMKLKVLDDTHVSTVKPGQNYAGRFLIDGGKDFIFYTADSIFVGNSADLTNRDLKQGDYVSIRASETPTQEANRFLDQAEHRGRRGSTAGAIERAVSALPATHRANTEIHALAEMRIDQASKRDGIYREHARGNQR